MCVCVCVCAGTAFSIDCKCGEYFSVLLSKEGKVYSCGRNQLGNVNLLFACTWPSLLHSGQLGQGTQDQCQLTFEPLKEFVDSVESVLSRPFIFSPTLVSLSAQTLNSGFVWSRPWNVFDDDWVAVCVGKRRAGTNLMAVFAICANLLFLQVSTCCHAC